MNTYSVGLKLREKHLWEVTEYEEMEDAVKMFADCISYVKARGVKWDRVSLDRLDELGWGVNLMYYFDGSIMVMEEDMTEEEAEVLYEYEAY